jgi:hypothetical protein
MLRASSAWIWPGIILALNWRDHIHHLAVEYFFRLLLTPSI